MSQIDFWKDLAIAEFRILGGNSDRFLENTFKAEDLEHTKCLMYFGTRDSLKLLVKTDYKKKWVVIFLKLGMFINRFSTKLNRRS